MKNSLSTTFVICLKRERITFLKSYIFVSLWSFQLLGSRFQAFSAEERLESIVNSDVIG